VVKVRMPPVELETPIDPSLDPKAEQERRFDLFLRYEGCGQLVSDDSEAGRQWRRLALRLAAMQYRGLQLPESRPLRKARGKPNVDRQILDAVSEEFAKAKDVGNTITYIGAFRLAKRHNPFMKNITERQFQDAKQRYYRLHPDERLRSGKART
jgi:hypothetical protein